MIFLNGLLKSKSLLVFPWSTIPRIFSTRLFCVSSPCTCIVFINYQFSSWKISNFFLWMYPMARQCDENVSYEPQLQKHNQKLTEIPLVRCIVSMKFQGIQFLIWTTSPPPCPASEHAPLTQSIRTVLQKQLSGTDNNWNIL